MFACIPLCLHGFKLKPKFTMTVKWAQTDRMHCNLKLAFPLLPSAPRKCKFWLAMLAIKFWLIVLSWQILVWAWTHAPKAWDRQARHATKHIAIHMAFVHVEAIDVNSFICDMHGLHMQENTCELQCVRLYARFACILVCDVFGSASSLVALTFLWSEPGRNSDLSSHAHASCWKPAACQRKLGRQSAEYLLHCLRVFLFACNLLSAISTLIRHACPCI